MVRRDADWKVQDRHLLDWVTLGVGSLLAVLYLYRGLLGSGQSGLLGVGLILVGVVYFTAYWQPILYLVTDLVLIGMTIFWFWDGPLEEPLVLVVAALNVVFVALTVYLFFFEEPTMEPAKKDEA